MEEAARAASAVEPGGGAVLERDRVPGEARHEDLLGRVAVGDALPRLGQQPTEEDEVTDGPQVATIGIEPAPSEWPTTTTSSASPSASAVSSA